MWGGFDLSAQRFNGRSVQPPATPPVFLQNGMTGEVVSVGFSFGDPQSRTPAFYAYTSPPQRAWPRPISGQTARSGTKTPAWRSCRGRQYCAPTTRRTRSCASGTPSTPKPDGLSSSSGNGSAGGRPQCGRCSPRLPNFLGRFDRQHFASRTKPHGGLELPDRPTRPTRAYRG